MPPQRASKWFAWMLPSLVGAVAAGAFGQNAKKPENPAPPAALFADLDVNHDGVVEAGEVAPDDRKAFDKLLKHGDSDRDGKLDGKEYAALVKQLDEPVKNKAGQPGPPLGQRLKAMDADADGRVSRAEFKGKPAGFRRLDVNSDGFIDRADRKAVQAKRATDAANEKGKDEKPKGE